MGKLLKNIENSYSLLFVVAIMSSNAAAQQSEFPIACVEGVEPLALEYGQHTTGCEISPTTDLDRFTFCALAGEDIRLNVNAVGNFLDPDVVIRDPAAVIVAQQSCTDSCTMSIDLPIVTDGCHTIFISDVNTNDAGAYQLQLERISPPADATMLINYDETTTDDIAPETDIDHFEFYGVAGTTIRLNANTVGNFLDPTVEIRSPTDVLVIEGAANGASCTDSCTFSIDIDISETGFYSMNIYDFAVNNAGAYSLSLWCLVGACDSDGDGTPDDAGPLLSYLIETSDNIESEVDADFFTFNGTVGTELRLNVNTVGNFSDPTVEIRDPDGVLVVNGVMDGASCTDSCTFSLDFTPSEDGIYSLMIFDFNVDNTGAYDIALWCLFGPCDSNGDGVPDDTGPMLSYVSETLDEISPEVDADFYTFNGTVGTELRLNVNAAGNFLDPTVEIRDPNGVVVLNGAMDSATCTDNCAFTLDFIPSENGIYTFMIYDLAINNGGVYDIGLWCISGPCDSDADGVVDGNPRVSIDTPAVLQYGVAAFETIDSAVDADIYVIGVTAGDLFDLNVNSTGNFLDPTIEIRDPNNQVIVNGVEDGATCTDSCTFSLNFDDLTVSGQYSLLIYDNGALNTGAYELSLQCLIGTCADTVAMCGDNCIEAPNGPDIPDAGGNVQLDTDGDGHGNACDGDFDNTNVINFLDVSEFSEGFLGSDPELDLNGDGSVNFLDFTILVSQFLEPPGPSCFSPVVAGD